MGTWGMAFTEDCIYPHFLFVSRCVFEMDRDEARVVG
jgi:hypothetical protein